MSEPNFNLEYVPILVEDLQGPEQAKEYPPAKPGEGSREHSLTDFFRRTPVKVDEDTLSLSKMQESFTRIEQQVQFLMNNRKSGDGFGIDEVTVKLGLSAKGGLAFIAEASIETSMEVKFKRR